MTRIFPVPTAVPIDNPPLDAGRSVVANIRLHFILARQTIRRCRTTIAQWTCNCAHLAAGVSIHGLLEQLPRAPAAQHPVPGDCLQFFQTDSDEIRSSHFFARVNSWLPAFRKKSLKNSDKSPFEDA